MSVLLVCAATLTGLALRLVRIGRDSIWRDEANTWELARSSWSAALIDHQNHQPPLYYLLTKAVVGLFGDSEVVLRLPAALIGTLCIPAAGLVAQLVLGGHAALVLASWFTALAPGAVFYSRQARAYSLFALTATACLGALAPGHRVPGLLAASLAALLYTHPFGLLAWGALGAYLGGCALLGEAESRARLIEWAVAGGLFLPYARVLGRQVRTAFADFWIKPLGVPTIARVPGELLLGKTRPALAALASAVVVASAATLPLRWALVSSALAAACWLGPAFSAYLFRPLFVPRYAIALQPLIALSLAAAASRAWPAGVLLLALLLVETIRMLRAGTEKEDWRGAIAHLVAARERGAHPVVVNQTWDDPLESYAFAYYARTDADPRGAIRGADGVTRVQLPEGHVALLLVPLPRLRDAVARAQGPRAIVDERRFRGVLFLELR
jgi:mannosyltransferase